MSASRRSRIAAVTVAAAVVTSLTGCGFATRQQAAAIVNGHEITQEALIRATDQLHAAQIDMPIKNVLLGLLIAPQLRKAIDEQGGWKASPLHAQVMATIPNPTPETKDVVEAITILQSGELGSAGFDRYAELQKQAKITVNPKYGVPAVVNNDIAYNLVAEAPNWIKTNSAESPSS